MMPCMMRSIRQSYFDWCGSSEPVGESRDHRSRTPGYVAGALASYLCTHHDVLLGWEKGDRSDGPHLSTARYDQIVYGLRAVLQPYSLVGLHCTKLTEVGIQHILANGMQLPDGKMLARRINQLVANGHLDDTVAAELLATNQADEQYRAGMVWFCFFHPGIAGESGIGSFFRFWGGEALYNSHDGEPGTGDALERIGIPCLVEAEVPIASLGPHSFLDTKIIRRFLIHRGFETSEAVDHEDRVKKVLPASCIRRIIRYPDPAFVALTDCDKWTDVLPVPNDRHSQSEPEC